MDPGPGVVSEASYWWLVRGMHGEDALVTTADLLYQKLSSDENLVHYDAHIFGSLQYLLDKSIS